MKLLKGVGGTLLLGVIWYFLVETGRISPLLLPSPQELFKQMIEDFLSGSLPMGLLHSLLMIFLALIPSVILGFFMALFSFHSRKMDRFFQTLSALAHPLPGIALLPLLIIWTGLGPQIILLIVAHSVIWPFYINLRNGFRDIPPLWIDVARNRELSEWDLLFKLMIPASSTQILSGLKISWARSWRAVIAAEMLYGTIGGSGGLGWFIYQKRIFMDSPGLFGGLLLLMITGVVVDKLVFQRWEMQLKGRGET
ncbi:MAG: ABC transporter permease subunit [Spirochaetales bacterium]|nr:ABC transporter permease subunit [Spirochaetales bacterium]